MAKIEIDVTIDGDAGGNNEPFFLSLTGPEIYATEAKEKIYTKYIYDIMKDESTGLDSIYEDYIQHCVGIYGLNVLLKAKLIESCSVVNGRKLYTLLDWKE